MNAACLFVAGVLRASIPAQDFTVAWTHSVEKTRWEEHYRVDGTHLVLEQARVQGSGAGMEPGPDARLEGGWWTWQPRLPPLSRLDLTLSPYTHDYDICWAGRCTPLHVLVGIRDAVDVVDVRPCRR
ncbi:MAG: DUF1850 domain-containing protein [Candidatus Levyibacteriota bacterium]